MSTWNLDQAHSVIGFKVKHLVVSTVSGNFTDFSGTIESADDSFENAQVNFEAKVASINTHNEARDEHLRSGDFFETEQFPTLSFVSTSFTKQGDHFEVVGDFTLRGVTKSITLHATSEGIGTGMDGKRVVAFAITGSINRLDYGVTWNSPLETGGFALGDEVTFDIHVEAKEA